MIDVKIINFNEGDQLIKAINIVTLRLLELSQQTTSYCALVKLLSESCQQEATFASSKYLELVMKCIWRQIRRLSGLLTFLFFLDDSIYPRNKLKTPNCLKIKVLKISFM